MKELLLELIKDIENTDSELYERDYGCDGSDTCCLSCGGNDLVPRMLVKRLNEIIKSSQ